MKKVRFIFRKIKGFQYRQFFSIINEIHIRTHRNRIVIFFDVIISALIHGNGYMDYFEFEFYLLNNKERKTYITSYINNNIIKKYNDKEEMKKFDNKITFDGIYKNYLKRDYIDLSGATCDDFKSFLDKYSKIICKPVDGTGGKGIRVINLDDNIDKEKLYYDLKDNNLILVEEYLDQHKEMDELYNGSINTLRVISFLDNNGVHILKVVLKIGNGGVVDNFSSGGMYTFVDDNGKVFVPAIDEAGNIYKKHPITNREIVGFQVPYFKEAMDLIREVGLINNKVRYVGWDVAITPSGPAIIEGNPYSGIFQLKPSISGIKTGSLPEYRKYMDI